MGHDTSHRWSGSKKTHLISILPETVQSNAKGGIPITIHIGTNMHEILEQRKIQICIT